MKKMIRKFIFPILCIIALSGGILCGILWRDYKDSHTVVFRISTPKSAMDYDLQAATEYLQYQFEKKGYTVLPWRYPGNFYHQKGDNAAINVFVRSSEFFYDTRMNKDAFNIYYMHRFTTMYAEELQNYEYYLSSQKNLQKALPAKRNIGYFDGGAVPHKKLTPQYRYDILFISENFDQPFEFSDKNHTIKYYYGLNFGRLTAKEKEQLLSEAKLVVYEIAPSPTNDQDYIPYAAYDIISYGRPLLTFYQDKLFDIVENNVYYYKDATEINHIISQALAESNDIREQKATKARQSIINFSAKQILKIPFKK